MERQTVIRIKEARQKLILPLLPAAKKCPVNIKYHITDWNYKNDQSDQPVHN
jgi:hypothetical protein